MTKKQFITFGRIFKTNSYVNDENFGIHGHSRPIFKQSRLYQPFLIVAWATVKSQKYEFPELSI